MEKESVSARFLYNTVPGRLLLKLITRPWLSKLAGSFLSSPASKPLIKGFVKKNGIDLSECESTGFSSFNDCFTRKLKDGLRPADMSEDALISPCDGLLSAYTIEDGLVIPVKQSSYSIADLLGEKLPEIASACKPGHSAIPPASFFEGGLCLVFRLRVQDYHRYVFFDSGTAFPPVKIPGRLHTIRPIALRSVPVFTENAREITIIESCSFGTAAQIEVGALMVGKIDNYPLSEPAYPSSSADTCQDQGYGIRVRKNAEKGRFLFGGSTIILLLAKNRAGGLSEVLKATSDGLETPVKLGQRIGYRI